MLVLFKVQMWLQSNCGQSAVSVSDKRTSSGLVSELIGLISHLLRHVIMSQACVHFVAHFGVVQMETTRDDPDPV